MQELNVQYLFDLTPAPIEVAPDDDDLFTVHTRVCVVCGATFQTCGKGQRCSSCLVGPGVASVDAHITCRVCDAKVTVALDHPALLCSLCLSDLDATRARVAEWTQSALARLDANDAAWRAALAASPAQDAWARVQGALIAVAEKRATQADLDRTWAKRKAEGGELAKLLVAYEAYARESDRIAAELARLHLAQTEINHAWLSEEV